MKYHLLSKLTNQLSKKQIKMICRLKNIHWKFGIVAQKNWFKKNIKKNDIHNLLILNSKLIGYTLLRKRTYFIKKKN